MKERFEILFHDPGHLLIRSETRPEVAHILNYEGQWENPSCSCERATINKERCKHLRYYDSLFKSLIEPEPYLETVREVEQHV